MKMKKNRTSEHFIQQTCIVAVLLFCLQPASSAHGFINPAQSEVTQLKAGQSIEREIAGGESQRLCLSHLDLMLPRRCPEFRRGQGQPAIAACYDQLN